MDASKARDLVKYYNETLLPNRLEEVFDSECRYIDHDISVHALEGVLNIEYIPPYGGASFESALMEKLKSHYETRDFTVSIGKDRLFIAW